METLNHSLLFEVIGISDKGVVRDHNEDDFRIGLNLQTSTWVANSGGVISLPESGSIFVLADGMGGANCGEVASRIAVEEVRNYFSKFESYPVNEVETKNCLNKCFEEIHLILKSQIESNSDLKGMGATLVVAYLTKGGLYIAWLGDSRVYQYFNEEFNEFDPLNPKHRSKKLKILTDDHSLVWEAVLKSNGNYSPEDARLDPHNNIITKYIGDGEFYFPDIIGPIYLQDNQKILICSDGLNGMLSDDQIENILSREEPLESNVKQLIKLANEAGGNDNISVIELNIKLGHKAIVQNQGLENNEFVQNFNFDNRLTTTKKTGIQSRSFIFIGILLFCAYLLWYGYKWSLGNKEKSIPTNNIDSLNQYANIITPDSLPLESHPTKNELSKVQNSSSSNGSSQNKLKAQKNSLDSNAIKGLSSQISEISNHQLANISVSIKNPKPKSKITSLKISIEPISAACEIAKKSCVEELLVTRMNYNNICYYISENKDNKFKRIACNESQVEEVISNEDGKYLIDYCLIRDYKKHDNDSIRIVIKSIQKANDKE